MKWKVLYGKGAETINSETTENSKFLSIYSHSTVKTLFFSLKISTVKKKYGQGCLYDWLSIWSHGNQFAWAGSSGEMEAVHAPLPAHVCSCYTFCFTEMQIYSKFSYTSRNYKLTVHKLAMPMKSSPTSPRNRWALQDLLDYWPVVPACSHPIWQKFSLDMLRAIVKHGCV